MVGATFEGMCYMHGMCFDMLTPMLYIFVWPGRGGATRDKGFAHVTCCGIESARLSLLHMYCSWYVWQRDP